VYKGVGPPCIKNPSFDDYRIHYSGVINDDDNSSGYITDSIIMQMNFIVNFSRSIERIRRSVYGVGFTGSFDG